MNQETRQKFLKQYEIIEGRKSKMYLDHKGQPHTGVGHSIYGRELSQETLDFLGIEDESDLMTVELNDEQIDFLFYKDLDIAINDAKEVIGKDIFDELSEERQEVLVDMSFNLGRHRFSRFKKMISAVQEGDFDEAAIQILDSAAARDPKTAGRYQSLSDRMKGEVEKPEDPVTEIAKSLHVAELSRYSDAELITELYNRHGDGA